MLLLLLYCCNDVKISFPFIVLKPNVAIDVVVDVVVGDDVVDDDDDDDDGGDATVDATDALVYNEYNNTIVITINK